MRITGMRGKMVERILIRPLMYICTWVHLYTSGTYDSDGKPDLSLIVGLEALDP